MKTIISLVNFFCEKFVSVNPNISSLEINDSFIKSSSVKFVLVFDWVLLSFKEFGVNK